MPRRWVRILLIVLAIAIALFVIGLALFEFGGEEPPPTGTGETLTGATTP